MNDRHAVLLPGQSEMRCLLVQHHLSNYREGVFTALDRSEKWSFDFLSGAGTVDGSIPGVSLDALTSRIAAKNIWIARRWLWQSKLLRVVLFGKYDAVIFEGNVAFLSTWVAALVARLRRVKVLFWTIGWHRPERHRATAFVRRLFYSLADRLLLYGEDARAIGLVEGYPARKMSVVGNSFSFSKSDGDVAPAGDGLLRSLELSNETIFVGAVVRLNPEKRLDLLVDAVALLRTKGDQVGLLLVGSGSEGDALRHRADSLGVPIVLPGAIHDPILLRAVYEKLVVTVVPERAGLTVMQSLAHGTPVVTVDDAFRQVPEFRAVVPGVTGFLYRPSDVTGLAGAIDSCLQMISLAPDEVRAACHREVHEKWSVDGHAGRIIEALEA